MEKFDVHRPKLLEFSAGVQEIYTNLIDKNNTVI